MSAANYYTLDHFQSLKNLENAKICYITGFFLTVSPETVNFVCKNKLFGKVCMNISAPFICELFNDRLLDALPFVDFLFSNETESLSFAQKNQFETKGESRMCE